MRTVAALCLALVFAGCADNRELFPGTGSLYGKSAETLSAEDNQKCREYGFEPGTEGYGNCRLKLEEIRAIEKASATWQRNRGDQGIGMLCQDALARGDRGAAFVHC